MKSYHTDTNSRIKSRLFSSKGMTMAEMLLTVAIIVVLAGLAFVAIVNFQRSMAQKERDGYAKELFIAAQNHLSLARGEGYLQVADNVASSEKESVFGKTDTVKIGDNNISYSYFCVPETTIGDPPSSMIDLMLPFGSVDENIRAGRYIICYQPETGQVLDVFYCSNGTGKFDHELKYTDYTTVKGLRDTDSANYKSTRRNMTASGWNGAVLGWYGGAGVENLGDAIVTPEISVENGDNLVVKVKYSDKKKNADGTLASDSIPGYSLKLIIKGTLGGGGSESAKKAITLVSATRGTDGRATTGTDSTTGYPTIDYVLDSVTAVNQHFVELAGENNGKKLIAGEDIEIQAIAYSKSALCNIGNSEAVTVNSLYQSIADPETAVASGTNPKVAFIGNMRHLENLEEDISSSGSALTAGSNAAGFTASTPASTKQVTVVAAKQTADLSWTSSDVYSSSGTPHNGFYPISPDDLVEYDGMRHSISNVTVSAGVGSNAGLFGTIKADQTVGNIELIDFSVNDSSANSGTLAGSVDGGTVNNVIAHTSKQSSDTASETNYNSKSVSGATAGGLVGSVTGESTIKYSGAAVKVSGSSNAGGLIGSATSTTTNGSTVSECFSGGHTNKGEYYEHTTNSSGAFTADRKQNNNADIPIYNVTSSGGNAGGLIGNAGAVTVNYSYSTCSASGKNGASGGLIGAGGGSGTSVSNCYCTGLVNGDYAVVGNNSASGSNVKYYEIINQKEEMKESKPTGNMIGKEAGITGASAIDEDAASFNDYTGGKWNEAEPYDSGLKYQNSGSNKVRYSFVTVTQLKTLNGDDKTGTKDTNIDQKNTGIGAYFVNTHYGDWPSPELFFINN